MSRRVARSLVFVVVAALGTTLSACSSESSDAPRSTPTVTSGARSSLPSVAPTGPRTRIVCSAPDTTTLDAAKVRPVLQRRLASMGVTGGQVTVRGDQAIVVVSGDADASVLCRAGNLTFRPLVAPAAAVTCGAPGTSPSAGSPSATPSPCTTPIDSSSLPSTGSEYDALSTADKQRLAARLAASNCAARPQDALGIADPTVACEVEEGATTAYALAPPVVVGSQIESARAIPPSTGSGGSTQWAVSLTLTDAGQRAWTTWTTAHNTASQQAAGPTQCLSGADCSVYVAFVLDGRVISAPATTEPIVGVPTQISGDFTATSAKALANNLNSGALPQSLRVDSVQRIR